jgi:hypothetical protein
MITLLRGPSLNSYQRPVSRPIGEMHGTDRVVRFSTGRSALYWLLTQLGAGVAGSVAIPAFIAEGVISPVVARGANCRFYRLDQKARPILSDIEDMIASANPPDLVIVYHPFGYPLEMKQLRDVLRGCGIPLLEDCAHALWSVQDDGTPVGTDADFTLYSYNKFFPVVDGAALVSRAGFSEFPAYEGSLPEAAEAYKNHLECIRRLSLTDDVNECSTLLADAGQWYEVYYSLISKDLTPRRMAPESVELIARLDADVLASRRRANAECVYANFRSRSCRMVYEELPAGVVPFGVPVACAPGRRPEIVEAAFHKGIHLAFLRDKWDFRPAERDSTFKAERFFLDDVVFLPVSEHIGSAGIERILEFFAVT